MSKVSVQGNASGTGTLTIAAPNTNTDRTLTLPDETGTILTTATPGVPVNGPAFSATGSSFQSFGSGTWTKIAFQTETFDTNNNYDNSTNYRFTPTVAGYYQISTAMYANESGAGGVTIYSEIRKNGTAYAETRMRDDNGQAQNISQSCVVYCNGSTDYIEVYGYISGGTYSTNTTRRFSGAMIRSV